MTDRLISGAASAVDSGGLTQDEVYKFKDRIAQLEFQQPPVGSILPFSGVSFANNLNSTPVTLPGISANTIAAVNTYLSTTTNGKWKVADGSLISDVLSPFNTRYMPNLTVSRFTMGSTTAGAIGGAATAALSVANMPSHRHTMAHNHNLGNHNHNLGNHNHSMVHNHSGSSTYAGGDHVHGAAKGQLYNRDGSALANSIAVGGFSTGGYGNSFLASGGSHSHSVIIAAENGNTGPNNGNTGTNNGNTGPSTAANTGYGGSGTAFSIIPTYLTVLYIVRIK